MDDVLVVEVDDGVALLTLNRPHARNALNAELRAALPRTAREVAERPDVRAIVLTGADPAFCAGLDLKELAGGGALQLVDGAPVSPGTEVGTGGGDPEGRWRGPLPPLPVPVIGAVNGPAITGGFELALACDFLVASERATFADTHARVGIQPGWGLTVLLPEAVGLRRAKELSTTGNFLDAATAYDWDLVNHVVPHGQLLPTALDLARDVAGNDPEGVAHLLTTYREASLTTAAEGWRIEGRAAAEWMAGHALDDLESRRRAVTDRGRRQLG